MLQRTDKKYPEILPVLTSLRFWAAYVVAFHHCCMIIIENAAPDLAESVPIISKLYLGVDFFFILSGFVLTHVYLEKLKNGTLSIRNFYIRRIARIYPAYLLAFTIALTQLYGFYLAGVTPAPEPPLTMQSLFVYLMCFHAWWDFGLISINGPSWSISAEWFAYLLFPVLLVIMSRLSLRMNALLALLAISACWSAATFLLGKPLTRLDFDFGILRIVPEFIGGIWLYLLGKEYEVRAYRRWSFFAVSGLLLVLLGTLSPDFWIVLTFGVIILLGAEQARQNYDWPLSSDKAAYLGEISYSVYLLHIPMLEITLSLIKLLPLSDETEMALLFLALLLVLPVAMLSYALIETPARKYINKKFG